MNIREMKLSLNYNEIEFLTSEQRRLISSNIISEAVRHTKNFIASNRFGNGLFIINSRDGKCVFELSLRDDHHYQDLFKQIRVAKIDLALKHNVNLEMKPTSPITIPQLMPSNVSESSDFEFTARINEIFSKKILQIENIYFHEKLQKAGNFKVLTEKLFLIEEIDYVMITNINNNAWYASFNNKDSVELASFMSARFALLCSPRNVKKRVT